MRGIFHWTCLCVLSLHLQSELQQPWAVSGRPSETPRQEQERQRCESNAISTTWNSASALSPTGLPFSLLCLSVSLSCFSPVHSTSLALMLLHFLLTPLSVPFLSFFFVVFVQLLESVQSWMILILQSWDFRSIAVMSPGSPPSAQLCSLNKNITRQKRLGFV